VIVSKNSLLLFVTSWLLLAVFLLPSPASAMARPVTITTASVSADTFPLFNDDITVSKAHLAWLVAKEEVGMQTTIRYIASRNGSTGTLTTLMIKTDSANGAINAAATSFVLDKELDDLRDITGSFHKETDVQMKAVHGDPVELRILVQSAVADSREIQLLGARYWQIRETAELSDFDQRLAQLEATLATLPENGNAMSTAEEKLGEIISMRTGLAIALEARDDTGIEQAHKEIHTISIELAQVIRNLRDMASTDARLSDTLDRSAAVFTRSGILNTELKHNGIKTTGPDYLVALGKTQLGVARNQITAGNGTRAQLALSELRKTTISLRDSYRDFLVSDDLPQSSAQSILSVAQSLDITASQLGAFSK
jgi:hypothetical protein